MDKVVAIILIVVVALGTVIPQIVLEREKVENDKLLHLVRLTLSEVLAELYLDLEFQDSISRDDQFIYEVNGDSLTQMLWGKLHDRIKLIVLYTPEYLRVDKGEGLGPPFFYQSVVDNRVIYFNRNCMVSSWCEEGERVYSEQYMELREESIHKITRELGMDDLSGNFGIAIIFNQTFPYLAGKHKVEISHDEMIGIYLDKGVVN